MDNVVQNGSIISILPSWLKNILLLWETISNAKDFLLFSISFLLILFLAIYIVTRWQHQINKKSQQKIDGLKNAGKYINDIFIELNDSKELLRYFLFGSKWKKKIVNSYNALFNTYTGKLAKENVYTDVKFHIPQHTRLKNIIKYIDKLKSFYEIIWKEKTGNVLKEDTGHLSYYLEFSFYWYNDLIKIISDRISMCNTNHILAIGSAGNGKTNLLCSFSETVMKYGQPCVFIDAKEIKGNVEDFLFEEFVIPKMPLLKINPKLFLKLYSLILFLNRKHIFVVIDALNENNTRDFHDNIMYLLNLLGKYSRIKILISCRNEYFNERFNVIFEKIYPQYNIVNINQIKYDSRAKEKAMINYQNYFNVKGNIVGSAKEKLFSSLLLMRIFFEVNKNKEINALELRNAEIYKQYIKQVTEKNSKLNLSIDFGNILDKIIKLMLKNNSYDGIPIEELKLTNVELNEFKSMLDENLIINKKIKTGAGITETESEIIYFVFDELRDYCISRNILVDCEKKDIIDYKILFEFLDKLNTGKLSPLEGVLKYSYYYLKNDSNNPKHIDICKKLLLEYGNSIEYDTYDRRHNIIFHNIGVLMIVADSNSLEEYELEYIGRSLRHISDLWNLLNILLGNEIANCGLKVEVFLFVLLNYTIEGIKNIISYMLEDDKYFQSSEYDSFISFCYNILRQKEISNGIKWIITLFNEVKKEHILLEKCIDKFSIGEKEKEGFIFWLFERKYPKSFIKEISKLINFRGNQP
jgi:hypothetical protein